MEVGSSSGGWSNLSENKSNESDDDSVVGVGRSAVDVEPVFTPTNHHQMRMTSEESSRVRSWAPQLSAGCSDTGQTGGGSSGKLIMSTSGASADCSASYSAAVYGPPSAATSFQTPAGMTTVMMTLPLMNSLAQGSSPVCSTQFFGGLPSLQCPSPGGAGIGPDGHAGAKTPYGGRSKTCPLSTVNEHVLENSGDPMGPSDHSVVLPSAVHLIMNTPAGSAVLTPAAAASQQRQWNQTSNIGAATPLSGLVATAGDAFCSSPSGTTKKMNELVPPPPTTTSEEFHRVLSRASQLSAGRYSGTGQTGAPADNTPLPLMGAPAATHNSFGLVGAQHFIGSPALQDLPHGGGNNLLGLTPVLPSSTTGQQQLGGFLSGSSGGLLMSTPSGGASADNTMGVTPMAINSSFGMLGQTPMGSGNYASNAVGAVCFPPSFRTPAGMTTSVMTPLMNSFGSFTPMPTGAQPPHATPIEGLLNLSPTQLLAPDHVVENQLRNQFRHLLA